MTKILLTALAPVILLIAFILYKDREKSEPIGQLLKAFFMGILSVFVTLLIVPVIENFVDICSPTIMGQINCAFWGAAIPEEAAKLLMLWLVLRNNRHFDEFFDGIVYAVMVGLGFACLENILYLFDNIDMWLEVGVMRALMAVPAHYAFAVFMGYFYSLAHFGQHSKKLYYALSYVAPVILHGLYDMFLMVSSITPGWMNTILVLCCYVLCYYMHKSAVKRINNHLYADNVKAGKEACYEDDIDDMV